MNHSSRDARVAERAVSVLHDHDEQVAYVMKQTGRERPEVELMLSQAGATVAERARRAQALVSGFSQGMAGFNYLATAFHGLVAIVFLSVGLVLVFSAEPGTRWAGAACAALGIVALSFAASAYVQAKAERAALESPRAEASARAKKTPPPDAPEPDAPTLEPPRAEDPRPVDAESPPASFAENVQRPTGVELR